MKINFYTEELQGSRNLSLIYRDEDYSFDIDPLEESGGMSIMINDLQLEIDQTGRVIYVWGYCPFFQYQKTEEYPKNYQAKTLIASLDKPSIPGVSYRLNETERWEIFINKEKGWVCIRNPKTIKKQLIEFAPNCIATLENYEIKAIWLKPKKLPNLILHSQGSE